MNPMTQLYYKKVSQSQVKSSLLLVFTKTQNYHKHLQTTTETQNIVSLSSIGTEKHTEDENKDSHQIKSVALLITLLFSQCRLMESSMFVSHSPLILFTVTSWLLQQQTHVVVNSLGRSASDSGLLNRIKYPPLCDKVRMVLQIWRRINNANKQTDDLFDFWASLSSTTNSQNQTFTVSATWLRELQCQPVFKTVFCLITVIRTTITDHWSTSIWLIWTWKGL